MKWKIIHRKKVASFFLCLEEFGANDNEQWLNQSTLTDFPQTANLRLDFASKIIDEFRSKNVIKSIKNLNIFSFGKFVDMPSFLGKNCPYPIGFLSNRCLASLIDEQNLNQKWFRCEIQSVAFFPVFVVSCSNENGKVEIVDVSPLDAWKLALQSSAEYKVALDALENTRLDGDWLFGLTHPDIKDTILEMNKKNIKEKKFSENSHSDNSDDA